MGQSMTRLPDLPDREAQSWQRQHTHRVRHPSGHSTSKAKVDKSQAPLYSNSRRSVAWEEEPQTRPDRNARDPTQRIKTANQAEKEPWISSHGYRYHSRPHEHQPVEISSRSHRSRKFDRTEGRQNPRPRAPTFETELPERPRRRSSRRELDGKAAIAHVGAASVKVTHEVHEKVSHVKSHLAKQTKECMVCTEKRTTRHFPNRAPTAQCEHEINTCKRCLRHWIRTQFSTRVWDQINCPECRVQMKYEDMREFAPTEIFRRYDRLSTRAALEAIPGFRWCTAKGCKSGQVHEGSLTPKFRCVACKASRCVVHNIKWHKGETCAEYDYRTDDSIKKAEEAASKKLIKKTAKLCPGCKWNIEKNNGCDHMTCSKCKYQFCWLCLAPYGPIRDHGNRMHRPNCDYFN